jgi:hypothetical protein
MGLVGARSGARLNNAGQTQQTIKITLLVRCNAGDKGYFFLYWQQAGFLDFKVFQ